jgi:creatinine amidohydrolase/Fe(II)-dependent formamide hydrolase-like protein
MRPYILAETTWKTIKDASIELAILKDIADVLNRHGIFKFLILNGHGGNDFKRI